MTKTPAQYKRGKDGRLASGDEPVSEAQRGEDPPEEVDWEGGEGFGSVGPAAFGTPGQQASLGDLQELQAGIQAE